MGSNPAEGKFALKIKIFSTIVWLILARWRQILDEINEFAWKIHEKVRHLPGKSIKNLLLFRLRSHGKITMRMEGMAGWRIFFLFETVS